MAAWEPSYRKNRTRALTNKQNKRAVAPKAFYKDIETDV